MNDFAECLRRSHSYADQPWWEFVYRQAFAGFLSMEYLGDDGWWQRAGIDRRVHLSGARTVLIDEKVREKVYGDILLEQWSDADRKIPGWVQKPLQCDYIAYAFAPSNTCYLLPFLDLRRTWRCYGKDWIKEYGQKTAQNRNYKTVSVPVPIEVLLDCLKRSMTIVWAY